MLKLKFLWTSHKFSYIGLWQWHWYGQQYLWCRQWFVIVSRTSAAVLHTFINHHQCSFVLYFVPFSDYLKDHNYLKVILTNNNHIFSFLPLFFTVKSKFYITLLIRTRRSLIHYQQDVKFNFIGSRIRFLTGNILHQQQMFKIIFFSLASIMVGPQTATKPWNFYSPEPLPLLP